MSSTRKQEKSVNTKLGKWGLWGVGDADPSTIMPLCSFSLMRVKAGVTEGPKISGKGLTCKGLPRRATGGSVGLRF